MLDDVGDADAEASAVVGDWLADGGEDWGDHLAVAVLRGAEDVLDVHWVLADAWDLGDAGELVQDGLDSEATVDGGDHGDHAHVENEFEDHLSFCFEVNNYKLISNKFNRSAAYCRAWITELNSRHTILIIF